MPPTDFPAEPRITPGLVRDLLARQFPSWSDEPLRPVDRQGWDNRSFRLGPDKLVRLPSAARYAAQPTKEQAWLPRLAPHLPCPIPAVLGAGMPQAAYPFHWSVLGWLPGETADTLPDTAQGRFATDLAEALRALHQPRPEGGPPPGAHNFHRGGDLRIYHQEVEHCLAQLGPKVDAGACRRIWSAAIAPGHPSPAVWLHGDVAAGNLLHRNGRLAGMIDFGSCGMGDPACDLTIAWTLFSPASRRHFAAALGQDRAAWRRARGWALWKALLGLTHGSQRADRILHEILTDPVAR